MSTKPALEAEAIVGMAKNNINDDKLLVMKGPLSEIFTKALNIVCAKQDNATGEYVMESAAIDTVLLKKRQQMMMDAVQPSTDQPAVVVTDIPTASEKSTYTVHGVNPIKIEPEDVVKIKSEVECLSEEEKERYIVVMDNCQPSTNSPHASASAKPYATALANALESFCEYHGVKVHKRLSTALEAFQIKLV